MQNNYNSLEEIAWQKMHELLDKEMPKRKRRMLLWPLSAAVFLGLIIIAAWYYSGNSIAAKDNLSDMSAKTNHALSSDDMKFEMGCHSRAQTEVKVIKNGVISVQEEVLDEVKVIDSTTTFEKENTHISLLENQVNSISNITEAPISKPETLSLSNSKYVDEISVNLIPSKNPTSIAWTDDYIFLKSDHKQVESETIDNWDISDYFYFGTGALFWRKNTLYEQRVFIGYNIPISQKFGLDAELGIQTFTQKYYDIYNSLLLENVDIEQIDLESFDFTTSANSEIYAYSRQTSKLSMYFGLNIEYNFTKSWSAKMGLESYMIKYSEFYGYSKIYHFGNLLGLTCGIQRRISPELRLGVSMNSRQGSNLNRNLFYNTAAMVSVQYDF